jgi:hypothetical protein
MKKITLIVTVLILIGSMAFSQLVNINLRQSVDKNTIQKTSTATPATILKNHIPKGNNIKATKYSFDETFEEGYFPPLEWTDSSSTGGYWYSSANDPNNIESLATNHTGHFAVFDSYDDTIGTIGCLETPELVPAVGYDSISYSVDLVQVSTNSGYKGSGDSLVIEFSTNGGATWTKSRTNVLKTLPNFNTATTGWVTKYVSLKTYNGQKVKVRFRNISDYGWCECGIDNVSGPPVSLPAYDDIATWTMLDFNGSDYYQYVPFNQLDTLTYLCAAANGGSSALTNVTLNVNVNSSTITGSSTPVASLAAGVIDTLGVQPIFTAPATTTEYLAQLSLTQTQTDAHPANNTGDSIAFEASPSYYFRSLSLSAVLSPYSFTSPIVAITGMEFGTNYYFVNSTAATEIDSIVVGGYYANGGSITGKLYIINPSSGVRTAVDSTAAVAVTSSTFSNYPSNSTVIELPLITPYIVSAGTFTTATVALTTTIGTDTIEIGSDGNFIGDASYASAAYMYNGTSWAWYSVGSVPNVGMTISPSTVGIKDYTADNILSIYPNPSNDLVNVVSNQNIESIKITNTLGQTVFEDNIGLNHTQLSTSEFKAGYYFVQVKNKDGITTKSLEVIK